MLITSAALSGRPHCEVCGAADKACAHAPTDGVVPVDERVSDASASRASGVYRVHRPEHRSLGSTRMRLSLVDVERLRALGATVEPD